MVPTHGTEHCEVSSTGQCREGTSSVNAQSYFGRRPKAFAEEFGEVPYL